MCQLVDVRMWASSTLTTGVRMSNGARTCRCENWPAKLRLFVNNVSSVTYLEVSTNVFNHFRMCQLVDVRMWASIVLYDWSEDVKWSEDVGQQNLDCL